MTGLDFSVRRMTEADLPAVAEIEAGVFTDWYRVYRRDDTPVAERTLEELRHSTSIDPQANQVAIAADGSMVGFILGRTWGRVGWFGTFGVPTQFQGQGIGKALVASTMEYLAGRANIVGLETMPESGMNIGLYTKLGFAVTFPTLLFELPLIKEADRYRGMKAGDVVLLRQLGRGDRKSVLDGIARISNELIDGLDYRPEVLAVERSGFGETVFHEGRGGRVDGFAVLRTAPFRKGDAADSGRAYLHLLGISPGADLETVFGDLIRQVWTIGVSRGFARLSTGASSRRADAPALLLGGGFRSVRAAVRMVHRSAPSSMFSPAGGINLARWAG
ncbi:MAG: GNAT family N-acetyltransferase [Candidatus Eisenbacteria bacterium]|nr:GNAT family N-acetyltransferase [Candidatus Eisenbacteria bacterium]